MKSDSTPGHEEGMNLKQAAKWRDNQRRHGGEGVGGTGIPIHFLPLSGNLSGSPSAGPRSKQKSRKPSGSCRGQSPGTRAGQKR